jgi:hypothetical protein
LIIQAECGTFSLTGAGALSSGPGKGEAMRKSLLAIAALAVSAVAFPAPAHAQRYYYGPGYYYGPPPQSYYFNGAPAPVADPTGPCYWQRQRFWDGFGWRVRSVRVCG